MSRADIDTVAGFVDGEDGWGGAMRGAMATLGGDVDSLAAHEADGGAHTHDHDADYDPAGSAAAAEAAANGYADSATADMVESTDVTSIVEISQAAYDLLDPPDGGTLYLITS